MLTGLPKAKTVAPTFAGGFKQGPPSTIFLRKFVAISPDFILRPKSLPCHPGQKPLLSPTDASHSRDDALTGKVFFIPFRPTHPIKASQVCPKTRHWLARMAHRRMPKSWQPKQHGQPDLTHFQAARPERLAHLNIVAARPGKLAHQNRILVARLSRLARDNQTPPNEPDWHSLAHPHRRVATQICDIGSARVEVCCCCIYKRRAFRSTWLQKRLRQPLVFGANDASASLDSIFYYPKKQKGVDCPAAQKQLVPSRDRTYGSYSAMSCSANGSASKKCRQDRLLYCTTNNHLSKLNGQVVVCIVQESFHTVPHLGTRVFLHEAIHVSHVGRDQPRTSVWKQAVHLQ